MKNLKKKQYAINLINNMCDIICLDFTNNPKEEKMVNILNDNMYYKVSYTKKQVK